MSPGVFGAGGPGARIVFALAVAIVVALAIAARPAKRMVDFDQSFYLTIAYDLDRHGVFSNGVFDSVDSTVAAPPPGMFFAPLYPVLIAAAMKVDARFARAVACTVEADHKKHALEICEIYPWPMHVIHVLFLTLGILAIALSGEMIFSSLRVFYVGGILAAAAVALEAELFSYIMTESVWFSLYSLTMCAFVLALKTWSRRHFVLAGALLGALCLARASFLLLGPVLLCLIVAYARWVSPNAWARNAAAFGAALLVVIAPWLTRNYVSVGKLRFTEEYGSATLIERFAFNDMTSREFWLAFPYCVPAVGPATVGYFFGADAMGRFEYYTPTSFFYAGRARRVELVAAHTRLDPIITEIAGDEMRRNGWRHLATTVPLAWCGLWMSDAWSLPMVPLFVWACVAAVRRRKTLFLVYAAPAILLVGVHAAIANHYPRYNLGLIGPFAVGAAWIISRPRRVSEPMTKSGTRPAPSPQRREGWGEGASNYR